MYTLLPISKLNIKALAQVNFEMVSQKLQTFTGLSQELIR